MLKNYHTRMFTTVLRKKRVYEAYFRLLPKSTLNIGPLKREQLLPTKHAKYTFKAILKGLSDIVQNIEQ